MSGSQTAGFVTTTFHDRIWNQDSWWIVVSVLLPLLRKTRAISAADRKTGIGPHIGTSIRREAPRTRNMGRVLGRKIVAVMRAPKHPFGGSCLSRWHGTQPADSAREHHHRLIEKIVLKSNIIPLISEMCCKLFRMFREVDTNRPKR